MKNAAASDITFMALLAAINIALEFCFGTMLHAVQFPFKGSIMVVLNVLVYSCAYKRFRRWGRISALGACTALGNFLLIGGCKFTALPAILIEAFFIDALISLLGLSRRSFAAAGAGASVCAFLMRLVNLRLFYGVPIMDGMQRIYEANTWLGLSCALTLTVLIAYRLALGAMLAWPLWSVLERLESFVSRSRLSAPELAAEE